MLRNKIKNDMSLEKNPLYPIDIEDYPKLFDYVLTAKGLVYFQELKHRYILAKELSLDEYNKLRLLYVYYATANRNPKEVSVWHDICITLDEKGIFEKDMYLSKENLKTRFLIMENPQYQSGLYRKHIDYLKAISEKKK